MDRVAGRTIDEAGLFALADAGFEVPPADSLVQGAIVAVARFDRFVSDASQITEPAHREWFNGPFGWLFSEVVELPRPVPCSGSQGLWPVPDHIATRVRSEYRRRVSSTSLSKGA